MNYLVPNTDTSQTILISPRSHSSTGFYVITYQEEGDFTVYSVSATGVKAGNKLVLTVAMNLKPNTQYWFYVKNSSGNGWTFDSTEITFDSTYYTFDNDGLGLGEGVINEIYRGKILAVTLAAQPLKQSLYNGTYEIDYN